MNGLLKSLLTGLGLLGPALTFSEQTKYIVKLLPPIAGDPLNRLTFMYNFTANGAILGDAIIRSGEVLRHRAYCMKDGVTLTLPLVDPRLDYNNVACGMSKSGTIVGFDYGVVFDSAGQPTELAYGWIHKNGVSTLLPTPDDETSYARGISDDGVIGGGIGQHAAMWQDEVLSMLPDSGYASRVLWVNPSGLMVGGDFVSWSGEERIGVWRDGSFVRPSILDDLVGHAERASSDGKILGIGNMKPGRFPLPFVYDGSKVITYETLKYKNQRYKNIYLGGINKDGVAVGSAYDWNIDTGYNDTRYLPALWSGEDTYNFNNLIADAPQGFSANSLYGINDSGTIVGTGNLRGRANGEIGFIAYPVPEPSGLFALLAGVGWIARRRITRNT